MKRSMRGLEGRQEIDPGLLLRDTRPLSKKIFDFATEPYNASILLITIAISNFFLPAATDILFIIGLIIFFSCYARKRSLPFRLPKVAKTKDFNDYRPGTKTPNTARGIAFFGNDRVTNEELWFHNEDMRTHVLMFGSTGSGKTVALISIAFNALVQGSGFIYVDGKGDNTLYANIFSMVRSMGREDDLLLINFMTGARDIVGPQEKRLSNTLNPFSTGSSSMLSNLITGLMDSSSQSADGDMWKGRAIAFVEALMKVLVYMRDQGAILLDVNTIRNYFIIEKLEAIVMDHAFPRDNQDAVSLENVPEVVLEPIKNYLINLPGYNREKKGKQVSQVLEQHGFITMQLTRIFSSLADTYGHILRTKLAEVDFKDVVLNRRILVVLLPALEKSPDELSNLGKVVIASLKAMMAAGLGEEVEGDYRDVILRKPTTAASPFLCILDEYGYYAVEGFAVVPAQARSLGFSVIFAGQDLPAFQKASKEEAASIGANTNIKICMKLEDPTETWDFFTKTAGEAYVTKVDSFQTRETSMTNSYMDTKSSSFEKRARIDLLDLKDQTEGEAHIFFRSRIVRARMFYANPKPVKKLKVNQFLKVDSPIDQDIYSLQQHLKQFQELLQKGDITLENPVENEDIEMVVASLQEHEELAPIDRGVAALMAYHNRHDEPEIETPIETLFEDEFINDKLNIFMPLRWDEDFTPLLVRDTTAFKQPLINQNEARQNLVVLEKLMGKPDRLASGVGAEIVKDMRLATQYPPDTKDEIDAFELTMITKQLCERIKDAREKGKAKSNSED